MKALPEYCKGVEDRWERLLYWFKERESIRIKKDSGAPPPWTEDWILQKYRFCNVKRMDDRVSRWLVGNWYSRNHQNPDRWFHCAVARSINWPDTLVEIQEIVFNGWDPKAVKDVLDARRARGEKIFTGAYIVNGMPGITKIDQVLYGVLDLLYKNPPRLVHRSFEETWKNFWGRPGIRSFMAGQIVADLQAIGAIDGEDIHEWAPVGPGSTRGLNRLHNRCNMNNPHPWREKVRNPQRELREVREFLLSNAPEIFYDRQLVMMDIQNCMCEFDKYERAFNGEGTPRTKYRTHA